MKPQTNQANTNTWLEASKDLIIRPYVEAYVSTLNIRERDLPYADLYEEIRRIGAPISGRSEIDMEFSAWDILSDEALINFEQNLD